MTRHNPPARYVLPETVDPTRRCIQVQVPDDPYHIAAFRGALNTLASAYNWQDDPTHKAKDVALVWRDCINNSLEWGCALTPTFRSDGCVLEVSYNDGDTWSTIFDASTCATDITNGIIDVMLGAGTLIGLAGILSLISDGTIGVPGQPSAGGSLAPSECQTFHVNLRANDRWHCPVPVAHDYAVTLSNIHGGWWDGILVRPWFCPSGQPYLLGGCIGYGITDSGDPMPSADHMRVVANAGSEWGDVYETTWSIPSGITDLTELYIQANDSNLTDNQGSISFDVTVCASSDTANCIVPFTGWTFDPATGDGSNPLYDSAGMYCDSTHVGNYYQVYRLSNSLNGSTPVKFKVSVTGSALPLIYTHMDSPNAGAIGYVQLTPGVDGYVTVTKAYCAVAWSYDTDARITEVCWEPV